MAHQLPLALCLVMGLVALMAHGAAAQDGASLQQKLNLVNFTQASSSCRKGWTPKNVGVRYSPQKVPWKSVISACRAMGQLEKRYFNFWIRGCFHDGLAAARELCMRKPNSRLCTGLDASAILVAAEFGRPEDNYEDFMERAGKVTVAIASYYDASAADVLALCGLVAVEELSEGKVKIFGKYPIRVGRRDNDKSGKGFSTLAPENTLPPADMTAPDFKKWWGDRSFGVELAIALLGTHALIDHQKCFTGNGRETCISSVQSNQGCPNSRMFKLRNHYFQDLTTKRLRVVVNPGYESDPAALALVNDPHPSESTSTTLDNPLDPITEKYCKFSSYQYAFPKDQPSEPPPPNNVVWRLPENCPGDDPSCQEILNKPNAQDLGWPYVQCDAYFGQSYIGHYVDPSYKKEGPDVPKPLTDYDVGTAVKKFKEDEGLWLRTLEFAMVKMVHLWAKYTSCGASAKEYTSVLRATTRFDQSVVNKITSWRTGAIGKKRKTWPTCIIFGDECNNAYLDDEGLAALGIYGQKCKKLKGKKSDEAQAKARCSKCNRRDGNGNPLPCSPCCRCLTNVDNGAAINECMLNVAKVIASSGQLDTTPDVEAPEVEDPEVDDTATEEVETVALI